MRAYINFQSWCEEVDLGIQNTSKLFSLKPIGIGTSMVESLSGYIARLAVEHRTTIGKIFADVFTPYLNKHYLHEISKRGGNGFYDSAHMINGVSTGAKEFSIMLNELTGNSNLEFLTLLRFANVIPQRGLLRTNKAWCPVCFEDMVNTNSPVYEPLIWLIKAVSVCRKHNTLLVERCPNCSRRNLVMDRRSSPGFCSHCNTWLGKGRTSNLNILDHESRIKAMMVERLLKNISVPVKDGIITSLRNIVTDENSSVAHSARKLGVPKTTFWGWFRGKNLLPISEVIRICNKYGIDIVDFYKGYNKRDHFPVIFSKRIKKTNVKITKRPLF
ncbi:helix-turn-helix domain-containing protein [Paenibacillus cisolokensis]